MLKKLILSFIFVLTSHTQENHFKGEVLITGSIYGELASCGCKNKPLGGFDQLYGLKASRFPKAILIDGGNLLRGPTSVFSEAKEQLLKNILIEMNYAAFVPGNLDLQLGFEKYKNALPPKAKIVLSNAKEIKDVQPYLLLPDQHQVVVVLGALSPKLAPELKLAPVKESLSTIIKDLKNKYQTLNLVFLLISHQTRNEDTELASIPELKWIINTHDELFFEKSQKIGEARWGGLKSENHYLAVVNTRLSNTDISYQLVPIDEGNAEKVSTNPIRAFVQEQKIKK